MVGSVRSVILVLSKLRKPSAIVSANEILQQNTCNFEILKVDF